MLDSKAQNINFSSLSKEVELLRGSLLDGNAKPFLSALNQEHLRIPLRETGNVSANIWLARKVLGLPDYNEIAVRDKDLPSTSLVYVPTNPLKTLCWLKRARPPEGSVIFDIGGGDGMTSAIIALMNPNSRVINLECQSALVDLCNGMKNIPLLANLEVRQGRAEQVDLTEGDHFFLFMPFGDDVQSLVLERIRDQAASQRSVVIAELQLSKLVMHREQSWLPRWDERNIPRNYFDDVILYRSTLKQTEFSFSYSRDRLVA